MKRSVFSIGIVLLGLSLCFGFRMLAVAQQKTLNEEEAKAEVNSEPEDADLAADLKLIQGSWELQHGNKGGRPTTRSVKTITGNTETLRRFNAKTGKQVREHSVEIKLSKSGEVRVCTFFRVGGDAANGSSFVYRVDEENFYDIPGMLQGGEYRNYSDTPKVWHWKRIDDNVQAGLQQDSE